MLPFPRCIMRILSHRSGLFFRPLAPNETDFEFLFLVVSCGLAASCYLWLSYGIPWPGCWFRRLTGLPCPTCGATRCAMSIFQGDYIGAFRHNPLIVICYAATLILNLYAACLLTFRFPRL